MWERKRRFLYLFLLSLTSSQCWPTYYSDQAAMWDMRQIVRSRVNEKQHPPKNSLEIWNKWPFILEPMQLQWFQANILHRIKEKEIHLLSNYRYTCYKKTELKSLKAIAEEFKNIKRVKYVWMNIRLAEVRVFGCTEVLVWLHHSARFKITLKKKNLKETCHTGLWMGTVVASSRHQILKRQITGKTAYWYFEPSTLILELKNCFDNKKIIQLHLLSLTV